MKQLLIIAIYFLIVFLIFYPIIKWGIKLLKTYLKDDLDEIRLYEEKEKKVFLEKKERLKFNGKYSQLFYECIWKSFIWNWKDYLLLLICNICVFAFCVTILGMKNCLEISNVDYLNKFGGLGKIILSAIIPVIIIAVFVIIVLLLHYFKCRMSDYGLLMTLGIRKQTVYLIILLEFLSVFLLSIVLGGLITLGIFGISINKMNIKLGETLAWQSVGIDPYIKGTVFVLLIYLLVFLVIGNTIKKLNFGQIIDLNITPEILPERFQKIIIFVGCTVCLFCVYQYSILYNHENVYLLVAFVLAIILVIRNGMAKYLINARKRGRYLKKIVIHNSLIHKFATNTGYMGSLFVVHFCVLFYFSTQLITGFIAEQQEEKDLYPYSMMCLADEEDKGFFEDLLREYNLEIYVYPMVRVSAFDSTERRENYSKEGLPVQGQHIGISERTYHSLKKYLDPDYEIKTLGLKDDGSNIYIVYQQDKSINAKPIGFYYQIETPFLHIGTPCRTVEFNYMTRKDLGYKFYEVCGEEIGSLTGAFRKGKRENLIVFSDEYFSEAQEMWKERDFYSGKYIEDEEKRIVNQTIYQGATKLVLINADEQTMKDILPQMEAFENRHLEEERRVFNRSLTARGIYDYEVSYHYLKSEALQEQRAENSLKIIVNISLIVVYAFFGIMLFTVKMLSENDENQKRSIFWKCMGMRKKERKRTIQKEYFVYYYLFPVGMAVISTLLFTISMFGARMYTFDDIKKYAENIFLIGGIYLFGTFVALWIIEKIYCSKLE